MIVVDTNLVVYLITAQDPSSRVLHIHEQDPDWIAPPILASEVRNVLVGMVRRGYVPLAEAVDMAGFAGDVLAGEYYEVSGASVLETAVATGLTAYDAEFVVLARTLGLRLVTADGEILAKAPDVAVSLEAY